MSDYRSVETNMFVLTIHTTRRDRLRPVHNGSCFLTMVDDTEVVPPTMARIAAAETLFPSAGLGKRPRYSTFTATASAVSIGSPASAFSTHCLIRWSATGRLGSSARMVARRLITVIA